MVRYYSLFVESSGDLLTLQRVCKLQEQAAVSDDAITGVQSGCDLRLSLYAVPESDGAPAKLVSSHFDVHEGLVFTVTQHRGIRYGNGVLDCAGIHHYRHVHVFLKLLAGIAGFYARLQSARGRIQGSRNVGNTAMEHVGIRV